MERGLKLKRLLTLVFVALLVFGMLFSKAVAEEGYYKGYGEPTPEVMPENKVHTEDIHWIKIINDFNWSY